MEKKIEKGEFISQVETFARMMSEAVMGHGGKVVESIKGDGKLRVAIEITSIGASPLMVIKTWCRYGKR